MKKQTTRDKQTKQDDRREYQTKSYPRGRKVLTKS